MKRTLLLVLVVAGCRNEGTGRPRRSPSASASSAGAPALPPRPVTSRAQAEVALCRVIAVRPTAEAPLDAGAQPQVPSVGTALEGRDWLDIAGKTEVVLRHSLTTRELALRGPGRFLPCFLGTETVLVARGSVKTTAGAGARAGAEVILATPLGTLHFADAALELRVGEREMVTSVEAGVVALVPPTNPTADAGPEVVSLGPKSKKRLTGAVAMSELVSRCAEASRPLGTEPPRNPAGVPSARAMLGEWSVAQLRARQAARYSCATARAAAGREEGPERTRRWTELTALDRVWRAP